MVQWKDLEATLEVREERDSVILIVYRECDEIY